MKKIIAMVLTAAMAMSVGGPAFAEDHNDIMDEIASGTIQTSQYIDDSGVTISSYNNLHEFSNSVHENYPNISDYELANYIISYTNQDSEAMPYEEKMNILNYDNISTSTQVFLVNDDGTCIEAVDLVVPLDTWNNGVMEITTSYSITGISGNEKECEVWANARWLQYPQVCIQDVFALTTTGTFNSHVYDSGSVLQSFYCKSCRKTTFFNRFVNSNGTYNDGDLNLIYSNGLPALRFSPISPRCQYCSLGSPEDANFTTYIRYGMRTTSSASIQASYGHLTFGVGNIGVSYVPSTNNVSFSVPIGGKLTRYDARPVIVR